MTLLIGKWLLGAAFGAGLLGTIWWHRAERHQEKVRRHLEPTAEGGQKTSLGAAGGAGRMPAWLRNLAESAAEHADSLSFRGDRERIARLLVYAGQPFGLNERLFGGLRIVALTAGMFLGNGILLLGISYLAPFFLMAIGYFGPYLWLRDRAQNRQASIDRALPDFLDTVACSLDSGGVGLYQAMEEALPFFNGPLASELRRFLQEIRLGVPNKEALAALSGRTNCRELNRLIQTLMQADSVGGSVVQSFTIHSATVRESRAVHARKQAAKAETTLTMVGTVGMGFVSLLFIFALIGLNVAYNPTFAAVRTLFSRQ